MMPSDLYLSVAREVQEWIAEQTARAGPAAMTDYQTFLASKAATLQPSGIVVPELAVNPTLFPFQRVLVVWALRKGRAALFCDTGLGKTFMQIEWARLTGQQTLILAPLAVARQTKREGAKLGVDVTYARSQDEVTGQITITNYEMLSHFRPEVFGAVVLDESSILKSFDGKTRGRLIEAFAGTPYRLCCTATPAPNDLEEFGNHAEFLGVCSRRDMLASYFVHRDTGWSVKGHAQEPFYKWLASWSMILKHPQDLGFVTEDYDLPSLIVQPEWVEADTTAIAHAAGRLFMDGLQGIQGRHAARKATITDKVARVAEIVNGDVHNEQWLVWCGLNDEGHMAEAAIPGSVNVEGKADADWKAEQIERFIDGKTRVMITKSKIGGMGLNLQNCHNQIFLGINDSYEAYYQCIRRSWRFGQTSPVTVKVVLSHAEAAILENVQRKEKTTQEVSRRMMKAVTGYEKEELGMSETKAVYATGEATGDGWRMLLGDCVERVREEIPDSSIDFTIFSPPFLSLYSYTASERDMGNSRTDGEWLKHFGYLIDELMRVTKQGRLVATHVAQVPTTLVDDGVIGMKDFRGAVINAYQEHGFIYQGEVCIDKDPQMQAIRTHSKGLLFAQLKKDSSWLRPAMADYILVFRRPGENAVPIHPDLTNDEWIEWARPIWYGIRESDTLNVAEARTEKDEKHICPLQLGTIERCIRLWSNPGEMILSPFAGIGSEGYQTLKLGRRFTGIELKPEYHAVACRNLERATASKTQTVMAL